VIAVLLAPTPLLVVGVLLVGLLWSATRVTPVAWFAAAVIAVTVWEMPVEFASAASLTGVMAAIDPGARYSRSQSCCCS
jgi:lactate permease